MPKQVTKFILAVDFDTDLDDISQIEFVFCQTSAENAPILKSCVWVNGSESAGCVRDGTNDTILISWSIADTLLFKREHTFYMDTRITPVGSTDNLLTPIVSLYMSPSLFVEGE